MINIIEEESKHHSKVEDLIKSAFENEEYSDKQEHFLVNRLRKSESFVPELSLVALEEGKEVGHILFTKIKVNNDTDSFEGLALAPVAVSPLHQKKGIGGKLILKGHEIATQLGFDFVVLLGHDKYYPKFGYEKASNYNIKLPFDVPEENVMCIALQEEGLTKVSGVVEYDKAFFE